MRELKKSCLQSPPAPSFGHSKLMPISPMLQALKTLIRAVLVLAIVTVATRASAQNKLDDLFPSYGGPTLHLSGDLANGTVTISWPPGIGEWELMVQQPAFTGEWKPIAAGLYQTNATSVFITAPVPDKPALYRLRRAFLSHRASLHALPPMPTPPTNRPTPPKLPGHA
jgi:hypothetical protein